MKLCILDAWHRDDPALVNSHWVAERTADALQRELRDGDVQVVSGDDIDRARVAAALQGDFDGFAYFGHGRDHCLTRHGVVLMGPEDVGAIKARWFHAFACLSGRMLSRDAARAGAGAYLGYKELVNVHWEISPLPTALRELLGELVTAATLQLAGGERSRSAIRARVREASIRLTDWLDMNEEACFEIPWYHLAGLKVLAIVLHRDLELEGSAVRD